MRPVVVELDISALRHNVQCIRNKVRCSKSKILAMVKANAYGHGLVPIARALKSFVEGFGVSCSEEALALRQSGLSDQRIVLMEGLFSLEELPLLNEYNLDTVLYSRYQLDLLKQGKFQKPINIWLKINTGMNRLGFSIDEFPDIIQIIQACSWMRIVCVMTHFSQANEKNSETTRSQINRFNQMTEGLSFKRSLANSAAILAYPDTHADWVRPGLILYGVSVFSENLADHNQLRPVMNLTSKIIAIHSLGSGNRVGYGGRWQAQQATRVGVVAIGYGDGYPHQAGNNTPVLVNNKPTIVIGEVSMDMLTVDLSDQADAAIGDPVLLWGTHLPIERVAEHTSTFSYELLCGINRGQLLRTHIKTINHV